jgi:hypothetical protein
MRAALLGESPFAPTRIHDAEQIADWLDDFPSSAMQGVGFGDQSIMAVWRQQCALHKGRRVFIWAYDNDLDGYDRPPQL